MRKSVSNVKKKEGNTQNKQIVGLLRAVNLAHRVVPDRDRRLTRTNLTNLMMPQHKMIVYRVKVRATAPSRKLGGKATRAGSGRRIQTFTESGGPVDRGKSRRGSPCNAKATTRVGKKSKGKGESTKKTKEKLFIPMIEKYLFAKKICPIRFSNQSQEKFKTG